MDLGLSRDIFDSFLKYQVLLTKEFKRMQTTYGFTIVDGSRSVEETSAQLKRKIDSVLKHTH